MKVDGFDWDDGNWPKCGRHGVSREEIEALLHGDVAVAPDPKHSSAELRYLAVGKSTHRRPLFVAFTFRIIDGRQLIRPVSARYMHAKEADRYGT